jgi:hypothetical protein
MSQNKQSYFQNGQGKDSPNTPTPGKKKYKSDKAILVQPRFEEPLYKNYDTYETDGVSGKAKHGPGAGWHDMGKYKSITEFLKAKRKKIKDKYKADDSWIEDSGKLSKKKKAYRRMQLLCAFTKTAIDFAIDDQINSISILPPEGVYNGSTPISGYLDKYLPQHDFEGNSPDKLNFGQDYTDEFDDKNEKELSQEELDKLIEKYLSTKESPLMGLPNGIKPEEDLDADYTVNDINPEYGTTDSGNTTYEGVSH